MKYQKIERIKKNHIGNRIEFQIPGQEKTTGIILQIGKGARAGLITVLFDNTKETWDISVDHITRHSGKFF